MPDLIKPNTSLGQFDQQSQTALANDITTTDPLVKSLTGGSLESEQKTIMGTYAERRKLAAEGSAADRSLIESRSNQDLQEATAEGQRTLTSEAESRRGFASNPALMNLIQDQNDKRTRQLTRQRDDLLLQNKIAEASRLDDLMVKEQEALTNAKTTWLNTLFQTREDQRASAREFREKTKYEKEQSDKAMQFALDNNINGPLFKAGNIIYDSATMQPVYRQVGPEIQRISDNKRYSSKEDFFKDSGLTSFDQISSIKPKLSKDNIIGSDSIGYFQLDPNSPNGLKQLIAGQGNKFETVTDPNGNILFYDPKNPSNNYNYDPNLGTVVPGGSKYVSSNPYDIGGFDIRSYATDPTHEKKVQAFYDKVGQYPTTAEGLTQYIQSNSKGSPITGEMILSSAQKYNVDPKLIIALMQQDSTFGTKGKAVGTKNPGNVGNNDSGATRSFQTWQEGVDAIAANLNDRRMDPKTQNLIQGNGVIKDSFASLAPRLSDGQRKSANNSVNKFLSEGRVADAADLILTTAISALPVDQQNRAIGRFEAIEALGNIENLLNQYQAKGGNTNILTGAVEDIAQKAGTTSNPDLAYIGSQIALALVDYRRAVSGAAFTESEAKFYENLFPSTGNVPELNAAKIASIRDTFNRNQKITFQTVLGAKNYDNLVKAKVNSFIDNIQIIDDSVKGPQQSTSSPSPYSGKKVDINTKRLLNNIG